MEIFRRLGVAEKVRNAGLPADYPHDISYRTTFTGAGADADPDSLPPRPLHDEGWPGLQLADAGAAASHQPDISRADPVRACGGAAAHPHHQPDLGRRRRGGGHVRRLWPCAISTPARSGASSCRYLIGCDGARSIVRKAIGAELSGDAVVQRVQSTYIRAPGLIDRQQHERAWGTGSINPRRSRHGLCDRRPRALAGAQLHEAGRGRFRFGGSRRLHPHHPRRRCGFQLRHHLEGGLVRTPADRGQVSRPLRVHRRRCRAYLGALCRLRHECRDCGRHEPVVAAGGASQRLGAGCHSRCL